MVVIDNENIQVVKLQIEIENTGHITNTYIIKDKKTTNVCVIDPAFDAEKILNEVSNIKGDLNKIIVTHSHADHIAALAELVSKTDATVYIHDLDYDGLYDRTLNEEEIVQTKVLPVDKTKVVVVKDKDRIELGNTKLEIIHTPGHTKGSMVILDRINNLLYAGDTLFENSYGRTDLITGSHEDMKMTLEKLCNQFGDIQVFSGHGNDFNLEQSKRKIRLLFAFKG